MPYEGHIENGVVVLDEPADLSEGTRVKVEVLGEADSLHPEILRFTGVLPADVDVRAEYAERISDDPS